MDVLDLEDPTLVFQMVNLEPSLVPDIASATSLQCVKDSLPISDAIADPARHDRSLVPPVVVPPRGHTSPAQPVRYFNTT